MSVERWDPKALKATLSDADIQRFLAAAARLEEPDFGLNAEDVEDLAPLVSHQDGSQGVAVPGKYDWAAAAQDLGDAEVLALIKLFTLAESVFAGWETGASSPVIPLAAALRERGAYPDDLTAWIKAHSDNRFLPYGSLLDRL